MFNTKFGIEIEFTGITRSKAATTIANYFNTEVEEGGTYYDKKFVRMADGRKWTIMSDGSIETRKKKNGEIVFAEKNTVASLCRRF